MPLTTSRDVTLLAEIVQAGSLSAAGRRLGLSPASISQKLAELERRIGVSLLKRSSRTLRLTREGEDYLRATAFIPGALEMAEEAARASQDPTAAVSGLVRLSAPTDLGRQYVSAMVDDYMAAHPRVTVRLTLSDDVVDLAGGGVDLAIRYGEMPDVAGITTSKLASNHRLICGSPAYLDLHGRPQTPADLRGHNCLCLRTASNDLSRWTVGRSTIVVSGDRTTNDGALIRDWALRGLGLVQKSFWDVRTDLATGKLERCFRQLAPVPHPLRLARPTGSSVPLRVRRLAEHLTRAFSKEERPSDGMPP